MKFSPPLAEGRLIQRYKRFLADVTLPDGTAITVHCPNTGSMKNCAAPRSRVWFSDSGNAKRKYRHTLEVVEVWEGALAGVNTGRANALVREAIESGVIAELEGYRELRTEVKYGIENSRVDLLLDGHRGERTGPCYVEIKNVTLGMGNGLGLFPDAVTSRGTRHLRELMQIRAAGGRAVLFFCVQHTGVERVRAAREIDPEYAAALEEAAAAGVEILAYRARISPGEISLTHPVPVELP